MALRTVYIELVADTKRLLSGFKKVDKKTSAMTRSFRRMGAALIGIFGARALFRGFNQTLKSTEALIKTAKGVGFAANEYQRVAFAMAEVGVSAESLRIGLGDLQKRLANPGFAKFYKQIGLTQKGLLQLDPNQQLEAVLQALRKIPDELLVGRAGGVLEEQSGKDFAKLVRDWETYARAIKDYNRTVGRGLTSRDAKSIEETGRQTRLLGLQWTDLKQKVVVATLPALSKLLDEIEESDAFSTLAKDITSVIEAMTTLTGKAARFRQALEGGDTGAFSLTPALGVTALRPPEGHETPQEAAERFAAIHKMRQDTGQLVSKIKTPNAGNVTQYTIMQTFNGVRDKDMPRKAGQVVEDVVSREVAGP